VAATEGRGDPGTDGGREFGGDLENDDFFGAVIVMYSQASEPL